MQHYLAWQLYLARRYEDAIEATWRTLELEPNHTESLRLQALALSALSRHEEALAQVERANVIDPDNIWHLHSLASSQFRVGQTDAAQATHPRFQAVVEKVRAATVR